MKFFQKLLGTPRPSHAGLPPDWRQTLRQCNFFMARREIANFFRIANQQAERDGKRAIFTKDIADGWERFAKNPCYETAIGLAAAGLEQYLLACCPGGALHKEGCRATGFHLGGYSLESDPAELENPSELTNHEYQFFPRAFKGEAIYRTAPVIFIGEQWQFMVSLVDGKIIKWAASLEVGEDDVEEKAQSAFQLCEIQLGSTTQEKQGWFFWDKSDGNVILQVDQAAGVFDISIFATSRETRNLEQL